MVLVEVTPGERLRYFFEVDRHFITVAALNALAQENMVDLSTVKKAMTRFGIDPGKNRTRLLFRVIS